MAIAGCQYSRVMKKLYSQFLPWQYTLQSTFEYSNDSYFYAQRFAIGDARSFTGPSDFQPRSFYCKPASCRKPAACPQSYGLKLVAILEVYATFT
jgi:hypothetical protein